MLNEQLGMARRILKNVRSQITRASGSLTQLPKARALTAVDSLAIQFILCPIAPGVDGRSQPTTRFFDT